MLTVLLPDACAPEVDTKNKKIRLIDYVIG